MRLLFYGSCRKEPSEEDVNEDRWAFSGSLGTLALCDGAGESFELFGLGADTRRQVRAQSGRHAGMAGRRRRRIHFPA